MELPSCYNAFLAGLTTDELHVVMEALADLSPCEYPSQKKMLEMAKTEIVYRRARCPSEAETKERFARLNGWIVPPCCATCERLFRSLVDLIDSHRSKRRSTVWLDSLPRSSPRRVRVSANASA